MRTAARQLAAVAMAAVSDPTPDWVCHLLARPINDTELLALADTESMLPLLYKAGIRLGGHCPPALMAPRAHDAYRRTAAGNLRRSYALTRVLSALAKLEVPAVVLQGASLWGPTYGDPGLRPVSDIDLWIPTAAPDGWRRCLFGLGYAEDGIYPGTFRNPDLTLDIHRHLLWADRIEARRYLMAIPQCRIFDRTITGHGSGAHLRCLSEPDQAIYLTLHLAKHNFGALGWIADLLLLTRSWEAPQWQRFTAVARQWGRPDISAVLGYLLCQWTGRPLPAAITPPDPMSRWLIRQRLNQGRVYPWASAWFLPAGLKRRIQLRYWMESVFPRRAVLEQIFADRLPAAPWRLKLLRLGQLAVKAGVPSGR